MEQTEGDLQKNQVCLQVAQTQISAPTLNIKQIYSGPKLKKTTRVTINDVAYIFEEE